MKILEIHSIQDSLKEVEQVVNKFDYFYLMGIYQTTEFSKKLNSKYNLQGSLFSIKSYSDFNMSSMNLYYNVSKIVGQEKIIIDFIPNHLGYDNFNFKFGFGDRRIGNYEWLDTLQLDYTKQETLDYMIRAIKILAPNVGGFRFDMAHLVLRKNYEQKHNVQLNYEPLEVLVKEAKKVNPNLLFIAETYQDYEELKNLGFIVYRVEPRRNQVVTIDCAKELVVIDNHDEKLLYWECNANLKCFFDKLKELSFYQNTLWYLPAIMGYIERPSANYYSCLFHINSNLKKHYLKWI